MRTRLLCTATEVRQTGRDGWARSAIVPQHRADLGAWPNPALPTRLNTHEQCSCTWMRVGTHLLLCPSHPPSVRSDGVKSGWDVYTHHQSCGVADPPTEPARFWRWVITGRRAGSDNQWSEFELWGPVTKLAMDAVAVSGSGGANLGQGPERGVDGSTSTKTCCSVHTLTLEFPAPVSPSRFRYVVKQPGMCGIDI